MNLCKKIGKSIAIAFSMYSKIPMVQFEWKEEDMRYSMCFFPLVGIVIGLLSWCWWLFCQQFGIGKMCFAFVGLAIILLVTGGIHMDGYMDTMDALHSYGSREKTLYMFADAAHDKIVKRSPYAELAFCALWQILMDPKAGIMQLICALTVFGYYYYKSKKEFGGITGDLAGYFVTLCEGALMVMAAIACL